MVSLEPGTKYTVEVYATKDGQKSGPATVEFTTDVDAPRDLTASDIQRDSATLTWRPPRSQLSGYTLSFTAGDGDEPTVREVVLSPTSSSYIMTDLSGSTEYSVTLQAVAEDRLSPPLTTTFTTSSRLHRHPRDCSQVLVNGEGSSGLHTLTNSAPYELRVDLRDGGETAYAQYSSFTIAEPRARYRIYVGNYSGSAGKRNFSAT
ncbi:hypothetical protein CRUP_006448 [Coryphaenoides rupestris]|nr:hypothetical protein CRUP_006448 [Coryphaenoides rupestris]